MHAFILKQSVGVSPSTIKQIVLNPDQTKLKQIELIDSINLLVKISGLNLRLAEKLKQK